MMTPINRLMPSSSSSTPSNPRRVSENETSRLPSGPGMGSMPPMRPSNSQDYDPSAFGSSMDSGAYNGNVHNNQGSSDDVVSEILRDVERGSSGNSHMAEYGEEDYTEYIQQPPRVQFQEPPSYDYNQDAEDHPSMIHNQTEVVRRATITDEDDDTRVDMLQAPTKKTDDLFSTEMIQLIFKEMRLPVIVAVLILLFGISQADDALGKLIPSLFLDGKMTYGGLIAKAIVGGLIFYAIQRIF